MELGNVTLEEWLKNAPDSAFKFRERIDYYSRYVNLKTYLENNVHKFIQLGANLKDHEVFLNDHGVEHIKTVIRRASELVSFESCELTAKEVFYLLCAIQMHDVGNIFGRYKHEIKAAEVYKTAGQKFTDDSSEQQIVFKIAQAHGGKDSAGGKDTISELKPFRNFEHEPIRTQLLASILRLADELADDKSRGARWPMEASLIPAPSIIYHEFSLSLNSVLINKQEHSIELDFYINEDILKLLYEKDGGKVFLVDEIYERLFKMHLERIYCMRFMKKFIDIEKIHVNIEFLAKFLDVQVTFTPIEITLTELGYPEGSTNKIYDLCPILIDGNTCMNGQYFSDKINKME